MKTPERARLITGWIFVVLIVTFSGPGEESQAAKADKLLPVVQMGLENLANPDDGYVPGELLIKFNPGASNRAVQNAAKSVGGQSIRTFPGAGIRHWKLGPGMSVERALEVLAKPGLQKHIEFAEPNFIIHLDDTYPDDTGRALMWGLHNVAQHGGVMDADIDAWPAAGELFECEDAPRG